MKFKIIWSLATLSALGACVDPVAKGNAIPLKDLPEAVIDLAGPNQDLTTVRVMPEDGCYWYQHSGPVETTLLPLRTADGRPICAQTPA